MAEQMINEKKVLPNPQITGLRIELEKIILNYVLKPPHVQGMRISRVNGVYQVEIAQEVSGPSIEKLPESYDQIPIVYEFVQFWVGIPKL